MSDTCSSFEDRAASCLSVAMEKIIKHIESICIAISALFLLFVPLLFNLFAVRSGLSKEACIAVVRSFVWPLIYFSFLLCLAVIWMSRVFDSQKMGHSVAKMNLTEKLEMVCTSNNIVNVSKKRIVMFIFLLFVFCASISSVFGLILYWLSIK